PGPPTGVSPGGLPPDGSRVVWFEDSKGDEVGRWLQQPFEGGETAPLVADAEPAWSAGLALGPKGLVAVGLGRRARRRPPGPLPPRRDGRHRRPEPRRPPAGRPPRRARRQPAPGAARLRAGEDRKGGGEG